MQYNILIEYTDNKEKAGKLTLRDNEGKKYLSKVPVAIPINLLNSSKYFEATISKRNNFVSEIVTQNGLFEKNKIIIALNNYPELRTDKNALMVNSKFFIILSDIVESGQAISVNAKKVSFLWFPESVKKKYPTDYQEDFNKFTEKKEKVAMLLKEKIENTYSNNYSGKSSSKRGQAIVAPTNSINNTHDLDPLDIVFMYNYPQLAPMYKPNSMLAWYMYFDSNEINQHQVCENVQNISGFEQVEATDLKYLPSGYSVQLYENQEKTKSLGVITYDKLTGCYQISSLNGEKTLLQVDDKGIISGCVNSPEKPVTNFNFVEQEKGFVGNWETSPTSGVNISSGMSVDSDYKVNSNMNKPMNLEEALENNKNFSNTFDATNNDQVKEWVPLPPPPTDFGKSSDSYSNSASFKM